MGPLLWWTVGVECTRAWARTGYWSWVSQTPCSGPSPKRSLLTLALAFQLGFWVILQRPHAHPTIDSMQQPAAQKNSDTHKYVFTVPSSTHHNQLRGARILTGQLQLTLVGCPADRCGSLGLLNKPEFIFNGSYYNHRHISHQRV